MKLIGFLLVNTVALMVTSYVVPGVGFDDYLSMVVAAIVIGAINTFIKPVVKLLTLPITFVTLGLFSFVLNVAFFFLASYLTPGFTVEGLIPAIIGSLVLSIVSTFLGMLVK